MVDRSGLSRKRDFRFGAKLHSLEQYVIAPALEGVGAEVTELLIYYSTGKWVCTSTCCNSRISFRVGKKISQYFPSGVRHDYHMGKILTLAVEVKFHGCQRVLFHDLVAGFFKVDDVR